MKLLRVLIALAGIALALGIVYAGADTRLERDSSSVAIQGALRPSYNYKIVLADTSKVTSTNFTARVIRIYCPQDCYIKLGGSTVAVTDSTGMLLPAGVVEYITIGTNTRLAAMYKAVADTLYITEME